MKTVDLLSTLAPMVQQEKQITPDFDVKLIGDALLTIDEFLTTDPVSKTFKGIPKEEWRIPNWASNIVQPQKVSIVTNNYEIPNLADRDGYGDNVTIKISLPIVGKDDKDVEVELTTLETPEELETAFIRLAGYYKKGIGSLVPLSEKSGDIALTDVEVVNNVLSDSCVPAAWNCNIPITLNCDAKDLFGENHCITKFRASKVCRALINALQGN